MSTTGTTESQTEPTLFDDVELGLAPSEGARWFDLLAVFDLETTGIDVRTSRIVTAHVGVIDAAGEPIEGTSWLADPGIKIPAGASAVHGINTEHAREHGRPAGEVVAEVSEALRSLLARGIPVVVYNAPYDLSLLAYEARRWGVPVLIDPSPVVDPLVIDKAVDRYRRGKRTLALAAEHYGVALTDAHDAGADAVAAGRVAQALGRTFADELGVGAEALHALQVDWCRAQAESFQEYMRRVRDESFVADGAWPVRH
ncbi:3'-5' exonuclease [Rathayibacter rathayi]|uniref:3'-5' exonuclease n=1 Tax=Rathayibacter rathayi TaxID=33887 RepID=A0ABD6WBQ1_RATRA|nr:3'-5' exonuclease [Rathayibacter rathayi]MWV73836.1 3'-5' exonuclease [Rathayibacter rathayi NCPPB 2980 = VKM Ac-1601]PPF15716.1 3'-5' exonuclease [Rathayibacter rathayi]PPF82390.1 3'-5' exonuclease [Rathayibacter rathayi]PPG15445.1 3'-5' exonuclease [Rathayibacter rathayi]